jgi:Spy/CpxP family protein refolding chaperone
MSHQWLKYLLIFSLSINLGGVATFLYSRFQNQQLSILNQEAPPPALRELVTLLNLDPEQREMFQKIFSAHRQNMQAWHREMALKRQDLLALMKDDSTAWPDFQAKLKELSDIQAKREEASLGFFLQLRQQLKPEQQVTCNNYMECRLLQGRGEKGEWCRAQGIHRPRGRGRWRSPVAPSQAPSEHGEAQQ